jgi:hypothetical protein
MASSCPQHKVNLERCTCTYLSCGKRATCCECLHSHLAAKQLPGCCFPPDAEATYDRSFRKFIEVWKDKV